MIFLDNVDISLNSASSITHRTRIRSYNKWQWLTIPIDTKNSKKINRINIVGKNWKEKHLKTIRQEYAKAPNFEYIFPIIERCYAFDTDSLNIFNSNMITEICRSLNIKTDFYHSSTFDKTDLKATDQLVYLINQMPSLDSKTYLYGKGGSNYMEFTKFIDNDIILLQSSYEGAETTKVEGEKFYYSFIDYLFMYED